MNSFDLEKLTKGHYDLHSQTVQALAQKLDDNCKTARQLRKIDPEARYPYKDKRFQTVIWKDQAIRIVGGADRSPQRTQDTVPDAAPSFRISG